MASASCCVSPKKAHRKKTPNIAARQSKIDRLLGACIDVAMQNLFDSIDYLCRLKADDSTADKARLQAAFVKLFAPTKARSVWISKTRVQLGVDNLFNRKAPYIRSFTNANTDTMTYDLLGMRFYAGFRTAF